jgi:hypothetical protein
MPFASKPFHASQCKRLASALAIIALCTLTAACSDDDRPAGTNALGSLGHSADSNGTSSFNAPAGSSAGPAVAGVTIHTPAAPPSDAGTALSAAVAPLVSPVIHTVD